MTDSISTETSFDEDMDQLNEIRHSIDIGRPANTRDAKFLICFIDKLWTEYSAQLAKADRLADLAMARGERR